MVGNFSFEKVAFDVLSDIKKNSEFDLSIFKSEKIRRQVDDYSNFGGMRYLCDHITDMGDAAKSLAEYYEDLDKRTCEAGVEPYPHGFNANEVYALMAKDIYKATNRFFHECTVSEVLDKIKELHAEPVTESIGVYYPIELKVLKALSLDTEWAAIHVVMYDAEGNKADSAKEILDYIVKYDDDECFTLEELDETMGMMHKLKEKVENTDYAYMSQSGKADVVKKAGELIDYAINNMEVVNGGKVKTKELASALIFIFCPEPDQDVSYLYKYCEGIDLEALSETVPR